MIIARPSTVLFILLAVSSLAANQPDPWESFKMRCQKKYNSVEEGRRHTIWEMNHEEISRHNDEAADGKHSYRKGENCFADLTADELRLKFGLHVQPARASRTHRARRYLSHDEIPSMPVHRRIVQSDELPEYVNWTARGWVGDVVDQGYCGSCWAHASAESMEAQYYNHTKKRVTLSRQNLIDCSYTQGNHGCLGGWTTSAFWYVQQNGIESSETYPDTSAETGESGFFCEHKPSLSVMNIDGWVMINKTDEDALQEVVALVGPVAVAVDASSWQFYSDGVYSNVWCMTEFEDLTHAVVVVGYGIHNETGKPYWLLKNSWGSTWGVNGYMMLARNSGNMCGVATDAAFPVMRVDANATTAPTPIGDTPTPSRPPVTSTVSTMTTTSGTTGSGEDQTTSARRHHRKRHHKHQQHKTSSD